MCLGRWMEKINSDHNMQQGMDDFHQNFVNTFSIKVEDDETAGSETRTVDCVGNDLDTNDESSSASSMEKQLSDSGKDSSASSWVTVANSDESLSNSCSIDDDRLSAMLTNLKVRFNLQDDGKETQKTTGRVRFSDGCSDADLGRGNENNFDFCVDEAPSASFKINKPRLKRPNSAPCLCQPYDDSACTSQFSTFKAKPIPKHLLDNTVKEKMLQEEEFRKFRIKIRAEEMLRSSASPIPVRRRMKRASSAEPLVKRASSPCHNPPDFKALHFKLARDLGRKSPANVSTTCRPFNLTHSSRGHGWKNDVKIVKEIDEAKQVRRRSNAVPAKMTTAAQLRNLSNRKKIQDVKIEGDAKEFVTRISPMLKKRMIFSFEPITRETFKQKVKELRKIEMERAKDYRNDLKEMIKRVKNQPLLVERQALENAKRKIEKQIKVKLKECGVSESFIDQHPTDVSLRRSSSRCSSVSNLSAVCNIEFPDHLTDQAT